MDFEEIFNRVMDKDNLREAFSHLPDEEQELVYAVTNIPTNFSEAIDLNFLFFMTRNYFPPALDILIDRHFQIFMEKGEYTEEHKRGLRW